MENLKQVIEALLFVAESPISIKKIKEITGEKQAEIKKVISQIDDELKMKESGMQIKEVAGGYKFYTHPAYAPYIEKFIVTSEYKRLTQAALETLGIISYKQPVTKQEINTIRGVNSESVVASLLEKGIVKEVGKQEKPGLPILYGTTMYFLEVFGLKNIKDLPPLEEFVPDKKETSQENE